MEEAYIPAKTKFSASERLMYTSDSQNHQLNCQRRPLTVQSIERKVCVLCEQEIDSPNYSDHVEMCNGEQSLLSTPAPSFSIDTGYSTLRTTSPLSKVKLF
jgi:hypothetical protein